MVRLQEEATPPPLQKPNQLDRRNSPGRVSSIPQETISGGYKRT